MSMLYTKSERPETNKNIIWESNIKAPKAKGEKAGEMVITCDGTEIGRCDLVFENDVPALTFGGLMNKLWGYWLGNVV